jgi:hypothetical protein
MLRKFEGTVTNHGLVAATVAGQFDEAQPHRGWFDWQGQHRFAEGQVYGLHLEDGRAYDIQITDVSGPRIKFEAIG